MTPLLCSVAPTTAESAAPARLSSLTVLFVAQAAPGPKVLFVALMGWYIGMNTGRIAAALLHDAEHGDRNAKQARVALDARQCSGNLAHKAA